MAPAGHAPPDDDAPRSPGDDRLDALLEARFAPAQRQAFARELDAHDRARQERQQDGQPGRPASPPPHSARLRPPRFQGAVPDKVRQILTEWLPELDALAAASGLTLRDPDRPVTAYDRPSFEREQGTLPAGLKLPASSYQLDPLRRRYAVRVVLPERIESMEALFTVLRALLTRLYGDVFLREEVYPLEAYREDVEQREARATVGLAEQIAVLAELPHTTRELDAALAAYAHAVGINAKRQPEQARKSWLREQAAELERLRLPPERQALIEDAFAGYLQELRADPAGGVQALVQATEAQERQLHFLPPDEAAEYERLRSQQPLHYLRSAKLRLEFLLSALGGVIEDFDTLAGTTGAYPALAEERIGGWMAELERGGLARPYLVPGVRLGDELEAKRKAFPLEVHALLARQGGAPPTEKAHRALAKRLEASLHQRLYNALVLLRHWMKLHGGPAFAPFAQSEGFATLKGLVANFRFRRPLLESLFLRIGVAMDVAEQAAPAAEQRHFPVDDFARGWGQFVAHALLADYLTHGRPLKGFDAGVYWGRVEARLGEQIAAGGAAAEGTSSGNPGSGSTVAQLVYLLRRMQQAAQHEGGLAALVEGLRQSAPAFRFAVMQALRPRPAGKDDAAWRAQLDAWAASVEEARRRSLRNAIVVGDGAGGG